MATDPGDSPW